MITGGKIVKFIEFFSNLAMPLMIVSIVLYGVIEKKFLIFFQMGQKRG